MIILCIELHKEFLQSIEQFLQQWLAHYAQSHRHYLTVAIGCTGGQHRSVYLVELLSKRFAQEWVTLKRHREMDALIARRRREERGEDILSLLLDAKHEDGAPMSNAEIRDELMTLLE